MARPAQVDSKAPRGKAAFHAILPALAFLIGEPWGFVLIGGVGAAMAISVLAGPRWSLIGLAFNRGVRRIFRIKPGKLEESAPHVFAEAVGAVFLLGSATAGALGATTVGWVLALTVVALAALNWLAGICVGCQMYLLGTRLRNRRLAAQ